MLRGSLLLPTVNSQEVSVADGWEDAKRYVEPVVADIDQPAATLLRVSVVLNGDGQESVF
jgi:hypothetical protein